jgi:hypothetical protein
MRHHIYGAPQLQFDFFEKAVGFLEDTTDDQLRRHVGCYAAFLKQAAQAGEGTAPDFGTELVWRTHLLMPLRYAKDCVRLGAARTIDHEVLPASCYPLESCLLLNAVDAPHQTTSPTDEEWAFLVGACRRQQVFMRKIMGLRAGMDTPVFISQCCVPRYARFLELMKAHKGTMLVPTLAIDLAWHSHQMLPRRYHAETRQLVGWSVNHDDDLDGQQLESDLARTAQLWEARFGEPYLELRGQKLRSSGLKAIGSAALLLAACVATALGTAPVEQRGFTTGVSAHRQLQSSCAAVSQYLVSNYDNQYSLEPNSQSAAVQTIIEYR